MLILCLFAIGPLAAEDKVAFVKNVYDLRPSETQGMKPFSAA